MRRIIPNNLESEPRTKKRDLQSFIIEFIIDRKQFLVDFSKNESFLVWDILLSSSVVPLYIEHNSLLRNPHISKLSVGIFFLILSKFKKRPTSP